MSAHAPTIGQLAQVACTWEVLARKAGNVCPGREFPDLTVNDFLKSAAAIAPVLDQAPYQPLGVTILRCIKETRKVVNTNTNLGIVLLLAPLASVPLEEGLRTGLARVLATSTVEDSRNVYKAIRLAKPGGLGEEKEQDVKDEPTLPLRDVMALAKDRDLIATQYVEEFHFVVDRAVAELCAAMKSCETVEHAIVRTQLRLMAIAPDSLIARKAGPTVANAVQCHVRDFLDCFGIDDPAGRQAYRSLDAWLRADNHVRNPGTTADLIAAVLFVALRERHMDPAAPCTWDEHPFAV
jgi:triphosphoribosyl-dephospho-CoA synthase